MSTVTAHAPTETPSPSSTSSPSAPPSSHPHAAVGDLGDVSMKGTLKRMRDAARKSGAPSYEERIRSLEKLERVLVKRKDDVAQAISRDFGNRSPHESMVS